MSRVLITGVGVYSPLGNSYKEFAEAIMAGKSAAGNVSPSRFERSMDEYPVNRCAGFAENIYTELHDADSSILCEVGKRAALQALNINQRSSNYIDPSRIAVCVGTSVGSGIGYAESYRSFHKENSELKASQCRLTSASIAVELANLSGARGKVVTIATACSSGLHALGRGLDLIRGGLADRVVAGGVDGFSELTYSGFSSLRALSPNGPHPFSDDRDGLMLGDGAAVFILEAEHLVNEGTPIWGELLGYGGLNEAFHATKPNPDGSGALQVMRRALISARVEPTEIDFLMAHATGTPANDEMEMAAISKLYGLGSRPLISGLKPMTGHTLGAAGSIEFAGALAALEFDAAPPTLGVRSIPEGYSGLGIVCDRTIRSKLTTAMCNSFGFGGNMVSVVVRRTNSKFIS